MNVVLWSVAALGVLAAGLFALRAARLAAALRVAEAARSTVQAQCQDAKRVTAMLEALELEHRALMTGCGAGVLILNEADVIERANTAAGYLLGAPIQDLVGRSLLQATLSADLNALVRAARERGSRQNSEVRAPGPHGYALMVSALPIVPVQDGRARVVLIAHDVTELRRLETVRRDFVANVSHELRTPLASIRAMAETLQDGALNDTSVAGPFLGMITAETERLTRISEDLLILSQAESRSPEKTPFDLSALLAEVVGRFQTQAERGGLTLRSDVPPAITVAANHDQIEQVVVNLVDNALKYTPAGGRVLVTAERQSDTAAVHVADTGIGIMSQDVPRIFERFYRVDKARSRQSGGTGLGLSIVKHIVEAHGGQVTVESELNRGSTFTISLPSA